MRVWSCWFWSADSYCSGDLLGELGWAEPYTAAVMSLFEREREREQKEEEVSLPVCKLSNSNIRSCRLRREDTESLNKLGWLQRNEAGVGGVGWDLTYSSGIDQGTAPLAGPGAD